MTLWLGRPGSALVLLALLGVLGVASALAVERLQLLGEVALQAAAVLALEGTQVLDLAVETTLLPLHLAEQLAATVLGLGVEVLRPGPRLLLELVGAGLGLGLQLLG